MKYILFILIPFTLLCQRNYTFDHLLSYETQPLNKKGKIYLTSQLVNSKDNSYYIFVEKTSRRSIELFFADRILNKYAKIKLEVNKLKDGDEIRIKKRMLNRLQLNPKKKSGWQLRSGTDTLIEGVPFNKLFFEPSQSKNKKAMPYYKQTYLLIPGDSIFKTNINIQHEFPADVLETTKDFNNGLIKEYSVYNPSGIEVSRTFLRKKISLIIKLIIE